MTYGKRTLIALDQLLNALLGGWPDETFSSRAWRWEKNGIRAWPRRIILNCEREIGRGWASCAI